MVIKQFKCFSLLVPVSIVTKGKQKWSTNHQNAVEADLKQKKKNNNKCKKYTLRNNAQNTAHT